MVLPIAASPAATEHDNTLYYNNNIMANIHICYCTLSFLLPDMCVCVCVCVWWLRCSYNTCILLYNNRFLIYFFIPSMSARSHSHKSVARLKPILFCNVLYTRRRRRIPAVWCGAEIETRNPYTRGGPLCPSSDLLSFLAEPDTYTRYGY